MKHQTIILAAAVLTLFGIITGACEKSNDVVLQEQYREAAEGCPNGCAQAKEGCAIKGNISGAGLHWFFMPDDREYGNVIVDPAKGEGWFCTPAEAEANGFRALPEDF